MTIPTAPDYIRAGSFYKVRRYQWIRPIIDRVLEDQFEAAAIPDFVDSLYEGLGTQVPQPTAEAPPSVELKATQVLQRIISIDNISNIGLVDLSTPIQLNPGLNIFYGKNASGKSSLYVALCNLLGTSKRTCHNLNKTDTTIQARITAEEQQAGAVKLLWNGGPPLQVCGARIFDSEICTFLVDRDQENQFEIAHLRSEYFPLLQNAISMVEAALEKCSQHLQAEFKTSHEALSQKITNFSGIERDLSPEFLELNKIKPEQTLVLSTLETAISVIQKGTSKSTIKNLLAAQRAGKEILNILGSLEVKKEPDGTEKNIWADTLGETLESTQATLQQYLDFKTLTDQEGQAKLGGLLSASWLQNEHWKQFIEASLSFVASLPEAEAAEYSSLSCPYCLQKLDSPTAKELLSAYRTLLSENKEQLLQREEQLNKIQQELSSKLSEGQQIPEKLRILQAELPTLGIDTELTYDLKPIQALLSSSIASIQSKTASPIDTDARASNWLFGMDIAVFYERFSETIRTLIQSEHDQEKSLTELIQQVEPLRLQKALTENRDALLNFLLSRKRLLDIQEHLADLVSLKRALSTCATQFSKEIPLSIFKALLKNEYAALNYTPPDIFDIRCATTGTKNKRVYSLREKRISEIFSEGERKIHALADFLAESNLNDFNGIYIFDDPVNSLDEDRIERVSDRVKKLVADGNQVLIFTHNLVFLNSLIDTTEERITEITRLTDRVLFTPELILGADRELSKRFREIQDRMNALSTETEKQADTFGLRNIYDLMSGYLESYVEIRIFKNVINRYRPNIRMHSLNRLTEFNPAALAPIIELYGQTSRKGSRHSQPAGAPEPTYTEILGHYGVLLNKFPI
ncbi:MAG: AAA family ATPase [Thermodesulfobacteriota bacterium]